MPSPLRGAGAAFYPPGMAETPFLIEAAARGCIFHGFADELADGPPVQIAVGQPEFLGAQTLRRAA